MKHTLKTCACGERSCNICGGLAVCVVCGGAEVTLTTHCCDEALTGEQLEAIGRGNLNYASGKWWVPPVAKTDQSLLQEKRIANLEQDVSRLAWKLNKTVVAWVSFLVPRRYETSESWWIHLRKNGLLSTNDLGYALHEEFKLTDETRQLIDAEIHQGIPPEICSQWSFTQKSSPKEPNV
jgi:hypothetical protein